MTTTADYYEGNMVTIRCPSCGDVWLDDPDITELRRMELLASRDRIAAIKTAAIMNGAIEEEDDDSGNLGEQGGKAGTKTGKAVKRSRAKRNNVGKSRGTRSA